MEEINKILYEINQQEAIAHSVTGKAPERVILGYNVLSKIMVYVQLVKRETGNNDIVVNGLVVTVDQKNRELIKVVPEV